jgi:hypothetical protein
LHCSKKKFYAYSPVNVTVEKAGPNIPKSKDVDISFLLLLLINVIRGFKSRRMSWAGRAACMGEMRIACRFLVGGT